MFEDIDFDELANMKTETRDLTCDEIKERVKHIFSEIECAYKDNWLQPDEHELETPEPIFDAEQFADDMTDIMFEGKLGDYWHSIVGGFVEYIEDK